MIEPSLTPEYLQVLDNRIKYYDTVIHYAALNPDGVGMDFARLKSRDQMENDLAQLEFERDSLKRYLEE